MRKLGTEYLTNKMGKTMFLEAIRSTGSKKMSPIGIALSNILNPVFVIGV